MELRTRSGALLGVTGESYDTLDAALPDVAAEDLPLLAGIDRYGNTMFNRLQLSEVARELETLVPGAPPRRLKMIREFIDLCRTGSEVSDAELWIMGD
jgi:hypothetical protein